MSNSPQRRTEGFLLSLVIGSPTPVVGMSHVGTLPNFYEKWGESEGRVEYRLPERDWRATEGR